MVRSGHVQWPWWYFPWGQSQRSHHMTWSKADHAHFVELIRLNCLIDSFCKIWHPCRFTPIPRMSQNFQLLLSMPKYHKHSQWTRDSIISKRPANFKLLITVKCSGQHWSNTMLNLLIKKSNRIIPNILYITKPLSFSLSEKTTDTKRTYDYF